MKSVLDGISKVDGGQGGICRDGFLPRVLEGMESRIHMESSALGGGKDRRMRWGLGAMLCMKEGW